VELLRLPTSGPAPVEAVLAAIRALPAAQGPEGAYPYVEVQVLLTAPRPGLRQEIEKALEGKAARLATIRTHRVGTGEALAEADLGKDLRDLQPEEVFLRRWRRDHEGDPPAPLLAAFYALLSEAGGAA
jgi:exonuclease SbcD